MYPFFTTKWNVITCPSFSLLLIYLLKCFLSNSYHEHLKIYRPPSVGVLSVIWQWAIGNRYPSKRKQTVNTCHWQSMNCQGKNLLIGPVFRAHFWKTANSDECCQPWAVLFHCPQQESSLYQIPCSRHLVLEADETTGKLWSVYQHHAGSFPREYHAAHCGARPQYKMTKH